MLVIRPISEELVRLIEPGHRYVIGEGLTEREAPSLSRVLAGAGLAPSYDGIDPAVLDFAARRGTLVHELIEAEMTGGDPRDVIDDPLLWPSARPYFECFLEWRAKHRLEPAFVETPSYQPDFGYACTADYLGLLDDEPWCLDWKTTSRISPAVALQTAGQCLPFEWAGHPSRVRRGALWLKRKGPATIVEHLDWTDDVGTVISASSVWRARDRYFKK